VLPQALVLHQGEANALACVGEVYRRAGDPDAARQAGQQASAILDELEPPAAAQVRADTTASTNLRSSSAESSADQLYGRVMSFGPPVLPHPASRW
jgi:hypothetical protein